MVPKPNVLRAVTPATFFGLPVRASLSTTLLLTVVGGCMLEPDDEIDNGIVTQAALRTTNCMSGGSPVRITANPPASGDASSSIQQTIDAARDAAVAFDRANRGDPGVGSCTVQAYIRNGTWRLNRQLNIPDRVHLLGQSYASTKLIKVYDGTPQNVINISGTHHVKIQNLYMEMRDQWGDTSPPYAGAGAHCIRAGDGISNFEIRNIKMARCRFYGIGLQCPESGGCTRPYENFTIKGVRLDWSGSDGLDMKSMSSRQNRYGEIHDLCFTSIGNNDDCVVDVVDKTQPDNCKRDEDGNIVRGWAASLDLAGDQLWVKQIQAINNPLIAHTSGIDLNEGDRRVTNSTIEDVYVKRFDQGFVADSGTRNVTVSNAAFKDNNYGVLLASWSTNVLTSGSNVCERNTVHTPALENKGTGNVWEWGSCASISVPSCSY